MANAGAVELIEATVAAGAPAAEARKWWLGELSRQANEAERRAGRRSAITPAQVARVVALVEDGHAERQAGPAGARRRAGRRGPTSTPWSPRAGSAVVSDAGALTAAVDEAIAANPDVAEKIRGGKVAAAGVLVGAVMKATRGQADAKTVRELILQKLS